MGIDMQTTIACAIELDHTELFEEYEAIRDWQWCDHREEFEPTDANYCPTCGKERPEPRTFTRMVPDAFPEEALALMREEVDDLERECNSPQSLESVVGGINGLSFLSTSSPAGGTKKVRLFLGKHLTSINKWSDEFCLQWSEETVGKLAAIVEEKSAEIGFNGYEAKLVAYNWWG